MFKNPYLVQRLIKPKRKVLFDFGSVSQGGFSDEAYELLSKMMSFDYMGSAEFEFGEVPKAFQNLANISKDCVSTSFEVKGKDVYLICHKDIVNDAIDWITMNGEGKTIMRLKEGTRLYEALGFSEFSNTNVCGWIELKNPFMFFTNKEMFENVKQLFEIK